MTNTSTFIQTNFNPEEEHTFKPIHSPLDDTFHDTTKEEEDIKLSVGQLRRLISQETQKIIQNQQNKEGHSNEHLNYRTDRNSMSQPKTDNSNSFPIKQFMSMAPTFQGGENEDVEEWIFLCENELTIIKICYGMCLNCANSAIVVARYTHIRTERLDLL